MFWINYWLNEIDSMYTVNLLHNEAFVKHLIKCAFVYVNVTLLTATKRTEVISGKFEYSYQCYV